jgi:hypothetical protein
VLLSLPLFPDTWPEVASAAWKDVPAPAAHPLEFRQRAVELAREGAKAVARPVKDLGISESWPVSATGCFLIPAAPAMVVPVVAPR